MTNNQSILALLGTVVLITWSLAACSQGAPGPTAAAPSPVPAPPGGPTAAASPPSAPSVAPPAATGPAGTPAAASVGPAPPGTTTFHVVLSGGPKAGTYDASSTDQFACSYMPELDRWAAEYSGATPLSTIHIDLTEDFPNFSMSFDSGTPHAAYMSPTGPFPYQVDDRGATATITFNLDEAAMNLESQPADEIGPVEVTVECASVYRYD